MAKLTAPDVGACVALIPDVATMQWHHAREEFLGPRLCKRFPSSKGALAKTTDGRRAWCIWTRTFGATPDEYVLNVLRLVVEGEDSDSWRSAETRGGSERDAAEHAIAAILEAAQLEASHWGMSSAEFWNPSQLTISAAKKIEPSVQIVDRDDESITSLRWHGEPLPAGTKIEWVANEKYAWC